MLERIRAIGYPVALVAQDGLEHQPVPWDDIDALFLGGTTTWKLSAAAADLTDEAHARGLHVHMGRINSRRRLRHAAAIGCHSADGTYLAYGPDKNLPKLLSWLNTVGPDEDPTHVNSVGVSGAQSLPDYSNRTPCFDAQCARRRGGGSPL
jgi:hypothetical protein